MAYDFRKWQAASSPDRLRYRWMPWVIGFGITTSILIAVMTVLHPHGSQFGVGAFTFPVLCCVLSPFGRETWLTTRGLSTFDEFERDAIRRASHRAYVVMLLAIVALFGWCWVGSQAGWPVPAAPNAWATLGFAAAGIGAALPVLFTEIMVPMPSADEVEEDMA